MNPYTAYICLISVHVDLSIYEYKNKLHLLTLFINETNMNKYIWH